MHRCIHASMRSCVQACMHPCIQPTRRTSNEANIDTLCNVTVKHQLEARHTRSIKSAKSTTTFIILSYEEHPTTNNTDVPVIIKLAWGCTDSDLGDGSRPCSFHHVHLQRTTTNNSNHTTNNINITIIVIVIVIILRCICIFMFTITITITRNVGLGHWALASGFWRRTSNMEVPNMPCMKRVYWHCSAAWNEKALCLVDSPT